MKFVKSKNVTIRTFQLEDHVSEFLSSELIDYQMNEIERKAADIIFKNFSAAKKNNNNNRTFNAT